MKTCETCYYRGGKATYIETTVANREAGSEYQYTEGPFHFSSNPQICRFLPALKVVDGVGCGQHKDMEE